MRKINKQQTAASKPNRGINLVLAGAGTGKTSTMINKIKNVIENQIVKPEEVLILTFSKKAADEIRERLISELSTVSELGFAGTFHSFSLKFLSENKEYYLNLKKINAFPSVIGNKEKEQIMRDIIMNEPERFLGLPASSIIKLSENMENINEKIKRKLKSGPLYDEIINAKILYENYKKDHQLIEFEDMINHAADLIETFPDLKDKLTARYRYIFVDEFQDTSENNFRLLSLLLPVGNDKNLFMVGDDYQSIYKFRNSKIEYIINADEYFPGITIHQLKINYRSNKEIIGISNRFIRQNRFRTSKKIISQRGKGGEVKYYSVADMHNEIETVNKIINSSSRNMSIAVLYRNNYQGEFLKNNYKSENRFRAVEFLTMHGSKGLEFDIVIIAGIADSIIPDRTTDIEEERRLFYVALTRAKSELHLLYYENNRKTLPQFIRETGYRK